jgi:hypothetical protein
MRKIWPFTLPLPLSLSLQVTVGLGCWLREILEQQSFGVAAAFNSLQQRRVSTESLLANESTKQRLSVQVQNVYVYVYGHMHVNMSMQAHIHVHL